MRGFRMKQLLAIALLASVMATTIVVVLAVGNLPVFAQVANLAFVPETGNFGCGEVYTLDLVIDDSVTDLRGASLVIYFDEVIVEPLSVTPGSLITSAGCPNFFSWLNEGAAGGGIEVDLATLGCSVTGPGSILQLAFEGFHEGVSMVGCTSGILRDGNNNDIPFVCEEARVDYGCPVSDITSSWGTLKSLYR